MLAHWDVSPGYDEPGLGRADSSRLLPRSAPPRVYCRANQDHRPCNRKNRPEREKGHDRAVVLRIQREPDHEGSKTEH